MLAILYTDRWTATPDYHPLWLVSESGVVVGFSLGLGLGLRLRLRLGLRFKVRVRVRVRVKI